MDEFPAEDFGSKEKQYILVEFPYPSGYGLHVGHSFTFVSVDIYARFLRMKGKNVLFPMGWDAFGLPTENHALNTGRKPQEVTAENIATYHRQMEGLELSFDWSREFSTTDPDYYRWTQWIFIRLFQKGLAFKQEMPINWCPVDKVGLSNEEVINGHCERCGALVIRRRINQWVVRITAYADRLLAGLEQTDFIEKVKTAQINWIGKSEGAKIVFGIKNSTASLDVFTTRPDTLWGCTFLVVAPEHPLVEQVKGEPQIAAYIENASKKSDMERSELLREKTGVDTGLTAIHPATNEEIPVWISDFVLPSYGSGAIMAVPAHDSRDFEFARKYGLPIRPVIEVSGGWDYTTAAYEEEEGKTVHSGPLDGMDVRTAKGKAIDWLESAAKGERAVAYHLRDWIFSRQHYWGEPIPMINCERCGWVPVPDDQLPVTLPDVERYQPTDTGESPLANIQQWVNVTCPSCGGKARRETDTMPNWAGSDWYFLRFIDPHNSERLADLEKLSYWLPVDLYIGGDEHNTLHLLYSRFIYLFLHDLGAVPRSVPEPYRRRISHGVMLGLDGRRMSKSRGNVILPDGIIQRYDADTLRAYLMFLGPFDATVSWNEKGIPGVSRFLARFVKYFEKNLRKHQPSDQRAAALINQLGMLVSDEFQGFKFNVALPKIMEAINELSAHSLAVADPELEKLVKILAPITPALAQKCWLKLGRKGSVHLEAWPEYDPGLAVEKGITLAVQVNGKLRGTLEITADESEEKITARAAKVESVSRHLAGKAIRKVIYIPQRTINFVVG